MTTSSLSTRTVNTHLNTCSESIYNVPKTSTFLEFSFGKGQQEKRVHGSWIATSTLSSTLFLESEDTGPVVDEADNLKRDIWSRELDK